MRLAIIGTSFLSDNPDITATPRRTAIGIPKGIPLYGGTKNREILARLFLFGIEKLWNKSAPE